MHVGTVIHDYQGEGSIRSKKWHTCKDCPLYQHEASRPSGPGRFFFPKKRLSSNSMFFWKEKSASDPTPVAGSFCALGPLSRSLIPLTNFQSRSYFKIQLRFPSNPSNLIMNFFLFRRSWPQLQFRSPQEFSSFRGLDVFFFGKEIVKTFFDQIF